MHLADRIGIVQLASNAPLLSEGLLRFYLACRSHLERTLAAGLDKMFNCPKHPMANWYYYNENKEKIGPIRGRELRELVRQGTITPTTVIEDETGRKALAKHVTGLEFPETVNAEPAAKPASSESTPSTIITNWHYYNENSKNWIGPMTVAQLQQCVRQGTITPETVLKAPNGRTDYAKKLPGLFPNTPPVPVPKPEDIEAAAIAILGNGEELLTRIEMFQNNREADRQKAIAAITRFGYIFGTCLGATVIGIVPLILLVGKDNQRGKVAEAAGAAGCVTLLFFILFLIVASSYNVPLSLLFICMGVVGACAGWSVGAAIAGDIYPPFEKNN